MTNKSPKQGEEKSMKAWKTVLIAVISIVALLLISAQASIAGLFAAVVIGYGPRRMRSLPRYAREDAAMHLLGILLTSLMAIGLSCLSNSAARAELRTLESLAAWLCIGAMVALGAFHLISCPAKPLVCRQRVEKHSYDYQSLPKAS
jgi:hypothetical protein